jgi:hypothetical protein
VKLTNKIKKIKLVIKQLCLIVIMVVFVFSANTAVGYAQMTTADLNAINNGWEHYDPLEGTGQGVCSGASGEFVEGISDQNELVIRSVIGVAKTYNLGQRGALIGIMTAITESGLKIYASSVIPESKSSPHWLAVPEDERATGSDHDSVGIMQQRPSTGWSTFGGNYNNADAETKVKIVHQLMDPVYSAQAFFGTPPGAELPSNLSHPSALKKGLQNLSGDWTTMDPWLAAQKVQISFDSTGGNYKKNMGRAQDLVDQYWDSSSAVPLAVSVNAENVNAGNYCMGTDFAKVIQSYAWPDHRGDGFVERTEGYIEAVDRARANNEYIGSCDGVDCGGFVTRVMRDSGLDVDYNSPESNVAGGQFPYLEGQLGKKYIKIKASSTADMLPGDIWINTGLSHTWIYVGDGISEDFHGDVAESSQCERSPMASNAGTRMVGQHVYRLISIDDGGQEA